MNTNSNMISKLSCLNFHSIGFNLLKVQIIAKFLINLKQKMNLDSRQNSTGSQFSFRCLIFLVTYFYLFSPAEENLLKYCRDLTIHFVLKSHFILIPFIAVSILTTSMQIFMSNCSVSKL